MAAPSGVYPAEEWTERWRGLISSWFQSAPLQHRSHSISSPQAAAPRMPKYANTGAKREPSPRFQVPSGLCWWWTKQSYLFPMLPWVLKLERAVISRLNLQPGWWDRNTSAWDVNDRVEKKVLIWHNKHFGVLIRNLGNTGLSHSRRW